MKPKYNRLREADRGVTYRMNKAGKNQIEIAAALGVSQGTISKELKRNRGQRGYRIKQSHALSVSRQKEKRTRPRVIAGEFEAEVVRRILLKHSPECCAYPFADFVVRCPSYDKRQSDVIKNTSVIEQFVVLEYATDFSSVVGDFPRLYSTDVLPVNIDLTASRAN